MILFWFIFTSKQVPSSSAGFPKNSVAVHFVCEPVPAQPDLIKLSTLHLYTHLRLFYYIYQFGGYPKNAQKTPNFAIPFDDLKM